MKVLYIVLILVCLNLSVLTEDLDSVQQLINRITPQYGEYFELQLESGDKDWCSVEYSEKIDKIIIKGNEKLSLCKCYNEYITKILKMQISWTGRNTQSNSLIKEFRKIRIERIWKYSYYLNVCTFSYSMVWWDEKRWEQEIDYMALKGINMALMFTGQEQVWLDTYSMLGLNQSELNSIRETYFTGSAFLAWNRMGNIQGYPNGLSLSFIQTQFILAQFIVTRMRSLSIKTILPAFNGYVPNQIAQHFPNANITHSQVWCNFTHKFTKVLFVNPMDPLYVLIQKTFVQNLILSFGTDHLYNGDQFNENMPSNNTSSYLSACSLNFIKGLILADPQAVWVIQGWLFYYQSEFWQDPQIDYYLQPINNSQLLILDLYSDTYPYFDHYPKNKNFIYNQLHDFGGNNGFYGRLQTTSSFPFFLEDKYKDSMNGIGVTMEGINQNAILYDFMLDLNWRDQNEQNQQAVDYLQYTSDYIASRYGKFDDNTQKAWYILVQLVYAQNPKRRIPKSLIGTRPNHLFDDYNSYDNCQLILVLDLMLQSKSLFSKISGYRYDLIDITREFLENIFKHHFQSNIVNIIIDPSLFSNTLFNQQKQFMLDLILDMDQILGFDELFLFGKWLDDALKNANNEDEYKDYFFNAKNQITRWGPDAQINDYAQKSWNGLTKYYYMQRWNIYLTTLQTQLKNNKLDFSVLNQVVDQFELNWNHDSTDFHQYQNQPNIEYIEILESIIKKYQEHVKNNNIC